MGAGLAGFGQNAYAAEQNTIGGSRLTAENRSKESHLAGASGIHMSPDALRVSHDLDLFHDSERAVAEAYEKDAAVLKENGFQVKVSLSQPGFIRAHVAKSSDSLLVDWARDSIWRFQEPVQIEGLAGSCIL